MPLEVAGQVGPQVLTDGGSQAFRQGRTGSLAVIEVHGRYYEQASRGNFFFASSTGPQTTSAALNATYLGGVCVSNPAGSRVNLAVSKVSVSITVISAAVTTSGIAVGYASTGVTVHTTPLTPQSTIVGAGTGPVAKADQACTLVGTPTYYKAFATTGIAASTFAGYIDLEAALIIPPGGYVCTWTSIASPAAAFVGSIVWEEVAV